MTARGFETLSGELLPTVAATEDKAVHDTVMTMRSALDQAGTTAVSVLIDPILCDPLAATNIANDALRLGHLVRHDLPRIHVDLNSARAPCLLHVADEALAERCICESIRIAVSERSGSYGDEYRGRSVCAWILGEVDPSALAARPARAARVEKPDGSGWPLRYWDPRVFQHLAWALQPLQHQTLLSQLGLWLCFDPTSALLRPVAPTPRPAPPLDAPMVFDESGWAKLKRVGIVNRVLDLAAEWGIRPTVGEAQRIDELVQRCRALGFATEQDALVFSACALTSRPDFDSHPRVAAALLRLRSWQQCGAGPRTI